MQSGCPYVIDMSWPSSENTARLSLWKGLGRPHPMCLDEVLATVLLNVVDQFNEIAVRVSDIGVAVSIVVSNPRLATAVEGHLYRG